LYARFLDLSDVLTLGQTKTQVTKNFNFSILWNRTRVFKRKIAITSSGLTLFKKRFLLSQLLGGLLSKMAWLIFPRHFVPETI